MVKEHIPFHLRDYVTVLFHKVLSFFNLYARISIQLQSMASIKALLFLALSFTMGSLTISDLLITFANHNHNNSLIFIAVPTFLFFLVPFTFISTIILLFFHVAIPQSAVFIKHFMTMATQVLVSATLLVGVPLMVHVTFTEAVVPNSLKIILVCATVVVAVATVYKHNSFKRYFDSASQTVGSYVPAFAALCISTGTFLYLYQNHGNPLVLVPIQLFLISLSCVNFILAVVLLFLYISGPTDGLDRKQTTIPAVLIIKAVLAMSFTTIGLIGFYMVVAPLIYWLHIDIQDVFE